MEESEQRVIIIFLFLKGEKDPVKITHSMADAIPRLRPSISAKNYDCCAFRHGQLLALYVLPKEQKDNHDYLLDDILARLKAGKTRMAHGKGTNPPGTH
jgi:hypothetical protein